MDQRCRQSNRLTLTTVAKFQASSTWDPQDNPSKSTKPQALSTWDPRYEPSERLKTSPHTSRPHSLRPHFSRPYFSQSENGETSDKKTRKEKKKHCRQEQARKNSNLATGVNASIASGEARNDLSYITCFNCDQKGHYATKCPEPKRGASEDSDSLDNLRFGDWG